MTGYRGVSERKGVWSWFHDLFLLLQRFDVSKLDSFHLRPVSTSIDTLQHVDRWLFNLSLIVKIPRRDPFSHDQLICNMRNIMDLSFFFFDIPEWFLCWQWNSRSLRGNIQTSPDRCTVYNLFMTGGRFASIVGRIVHWSDWHLSVI